MIEFSDPILTAQEAVAFEEIFFQGDSEKEWTVIRSAGTHVAHALLNDFLEYAEVPVSPRILVIIGKGHNAADALIAAQTLLETCRDANIDVVFVFGELSLKPLAKKAWIQLQEFNPKRVNTCTLTQLAKKYSVSLDGVFGAAYRNPLPVEAATVIDYVNKLSVDFRAAVDLPSGLNERGAFKADFTYATGSVKSDLLSCSNAGRIRYIDLGFFNLGETVGLGSDRVLKPSILSPLAGLRPSHCDKRTYGHLFIVGGSLRYPGSVLMTVKSALKSGVGLVTACVPEFLIADCAAVAPEAMWVGMPCNPDTGGMNLDGLKKIEELWHLATAIVIGPGMGRSKETTELLTQFFSRVNLPLVIDADALQQPWINALKTPAILTPHSGEFTRISSGCNLRTFVSQTGTTVVLKSSATRIMGSDGNTYISFYGGPVLARGGSGDLLAGLIGGLLAQTPHDLALAAARGAVWHGMAADLLARSQGQTATCVTELLAHLPEVLRTLNKT
jgi:ADP-dependent NAD(P)H-hydrate dehydratase / NAD(P)H-hydrate epimerase